jgi:hypothetical protein
MASENPKMRKQSTDAKRQQVTLMIPQNLK